MTEQNIGYSGAVGVTGRSKDRRKKVATIGALKRACERFSIDIAEIERLGVISRPHGYPFDMKSRAFVKAKTHILNEGWISPAHNLAYNNQDPVLLKYFADAVAEAGGTITREPKLRGGAIEIASNSAIGRAVEASGLPRGRKTITNPSLDSLVASDPEAARYHLQATLAEEGWFSLGVHKGKARFEIAWGRSVDIMDRLQYEEVEQLRRMEEEHGGKIPIRSIEDPEILKAIKEKPPRALDQELALLEASHPEEEWPKEFPTRVHVSKDNRATAFWEIHILRPDLLDTMHDEYGVLPGTWKAKRFEHLYEAYSEYRGKELTEEEIQGIRKVKEENPPDISVDWVSEKMQELFPRVEWGNDKDEIGRRLGKRR